jgi:transcriptional regulator GlxA family with amidase domain
MERKPSYLGPDPLHVSLVALPDAVVSTLSGIFDVMNAFALMGIPYVGTTGARLPFRVEIVGEEAGPLDLASGVPVNVQRAIDEIDTTDIVIVPSVLLREGGWEKGRYPRLVDWLRAMYARGAVLCSACSGIFLLAETGLFDGKDATVHYGYARAFASAYPSVPIHPERVLVVSGSREELVSSGASMSWHDMVLYLIAHYAGATAAQDVARLFALQWHQDGLAPYIVFEGKRDHGDGDIQSAQQWLDSHFAVASPVEEMVKRSRLATRTFKRRFASATGLTSLAYVHRLRVEDAKRRLERTEASIDEISWQVGYEDAAFFRRLFKRTTGLAPGAYRKRFRIPDYAAARTDKTDAGVSIKLD